jgi:hypothetical protein
MSRANKVGAPFLVEFLKGDSWWFHGRFTTKGWVIRDAKWLVQRGRRARVTDSTGHRIWSAEPEAVKRRGHAKV